MNEWSKTKGVYGKYKEKKRISFNKSLLPIADVPIVTCVFVRRLRYAFLHKYNYVYSFWDFYLQFLVFVARRVQFCIFV